MTVAMNGTFNAQILVDKLTKLNNSQQSIETLSHWCIFHRKKARQVVETWDRQFHSSSIDQRVSFLYLANDILQNSRRKGSEFVGEFWKVLPDALSDVLENGDEFGRNAAMRLVNIWEERKVFGSRGQILKEELLGRNLENSSRIGKNSGFKPKNQVGDALGKIISSYDVVYDGPVNEDAVLTKCRSAIINLEKTEKEIGGDYNSGHFNGSRLVELQGQHGILRECIAQLKSAELSRATLVSNLREALQEQEVKLDQLRNELQVAQSRSEQAGNICQRLVVNSNGEQLVAEQRMKEATNLSGAPAPGSVSETLISGRDKEQSAPVVYTQRGSPFADNASHVEEDPRKTAAAAVAAKLAASTSSAQMLSFVLSSLASEGIIGNRLSESSDYPTNKRPKLENGPQSYMPPQPSPPLPPFPYPELLQPKPSAMTQQMSPQQPPPPHPSSSPVTHSGAAMQPPLPPLPPPMVPPPPTQFMQTAGSMSNVPYNYGTSPQGPPPLPSYAMVGTPISSGPLYHTPPNLYQNYQPSDGNFYSQSPLPATPSQQ